MRQKLNCKSRNNDQFIERLAWSLTNLGNYVSKFSKLILEVNCVVDALKGKKKNYSKQGWKISITCVTNGIESEREKKNLQ